ncbi:MAG: hypothetical protein IKF38_07055 [Clostridia bacterium]|nr:hypothetical protein [Clostridia bacterium]
MNIVFGYWLTDPLATNDTANIAFVLYDGRIIGGAYHWWSRAYRPVICLPTSVLE